MSMDKLDPKGKPAYEMDDDDIDDDENIHCSQPLMIKMIISLIISIISLIISLIIS